MGASAALLLNALKELAGIDHDIHVISPSAIEPIQHLKIDFLGSKNPRNQEDLDSHNQNQTLKVLFMI